MSSFVEDTETTFYPVTCYHCGSWFAINESLHRRARERKTGSVYCPACGQSFCWTGSTPEERVREEMQRKLNVANRRADNAEQRAIDAQSAADTAEAKRRAEKAAKTRLKNRIKNGVCPCCKRHFKDLQRHMKSKHPEFSGGGDR